MLMPAHLLGRKLGFHWGTGFAFAFGLASTIIVLIESIVRDWPLSQSLNKWFPTNVLLLHACNSEPYEGNFASENYNNPYIRMQPYLLAIAIGYVLNHTRGKKIVMNKVAKCVQENFLQGSDI